VSAATADTDVTFNLNGTAVNVAVTNGDSAATVVSKLQTAISAAGLNITTTISSGKIKFQNSSSDNTPIVSDSFTVNAGDGTIFGFTNFTAKVGGVAGDLTDSDGKFSYSYDDGGVAAGLAGYKYFDELATDGGSFDIWIYNSDDTLALPQAVTVNLERVYDLYDVANAIETSITNASGESTSWISATVSQNRLKLSPDSAHYFAFANDTSNLLQTAGLNTFFKGHNAANMGINDNIKDDFNLIAAATVTSKGEIFNGDNTNALEVAGIQQADDLSFSGSSSTNSLDGFYNTLVGEVGNRSRTVGRELEFNTMLTNQLNELRDATSGVSLDEEMANLIKYQQAYTAAARIISMADEMLITLLESLQR
jgi:flagellar hook-associated protein 1 FlgK